MEFPRQDVHLLRRAIPALFEDILVNCAPQAPGGHGDEVNLLKRIIQVKNLHETVTAVTSLPPPELPSKFYTVLYDEVPRPVRPRRVGADVWTALEYEPERFFRMTGETPHSLTRILNDLLAHMQTRSPHHRRRSRGFILNAKNRLLMVFVWLREYPTLDVLATMFNVSTQTVSLDIHFIVPILWRYFRDEVRWPSIDEWRNLCGTWESMPNVVGALDGTLTQINRPLAEPQHEFYSGKARFHCLSTQIVIDCTGKIRYLQSGFLGSQNDAGQFRDMPDIGPGEDLNFPEDCYLLADKIYPNTPPLITPFRRNQMDGPGERHFFNHIHSSYRVTAEHTISYFKTFAAVKGVYRHQRHLMPVVADICASLAQRHILLVEQLR